MREEIARQWVAKGRPAAKRPRPGLGWLEVPSCNRHAVPEALSRELQTHTTMASLRSTLEPSCSIHACGSSTGICSSSSGAAALLSVTQASHVITPPPSRLSAVADAATTGVTLASSAAGMNCGDRRGDVEAPAANVPSAATRYNYDINVSAVTEGAGAAARPAKGASTLAAATGTAGGGKATGIAQVTAASSTGARFHVSEGSPVEGSSASSASTAVTQRLSGYERKRTRWQRALTLLEGQRLPHYLMQGFVAAVRMALGDLEVEMRVPKPELAHGGATPATTTSLASRALWAVADTECVAKTSVQQGSAPPRSPIEAKHQAMSELAAAAAVAAAMAAATMPALCDRACAARCVGSPPASGDEEGELSDISSCEIAWKQHLCRSLDWIIQYVEETRQSCVNVDARAPGGGGTSGTGLRRLQQVIACAFTQERSQLIPHCAPWRRSKRELCRSNVAQQCLLLVERLRSRLNSLFGQMCMQLAATLRIDHVPGSATPLRDQLNQIFSAGRYRNYQVLTKAGYNELIGQKRLWVAGEREALLEQLCTREGRKWITKEYFVQHTSKSACEVYVLMHLPTASIHALAAVADFQTPWTAGQFQHMSHSCQEDRLFFFGKRSEIGAMPRVSYDSAASFEGGTRWTSHFHLPSLLSVDIICAKPGMRGLALALIAHIACQQSSFLARRSHLLFDISGRESNSRMVRFTQAIGAQRYQTFADEARSEGFIGVEGDDPNIYWTFKQGSGFGPNLNRTAGVYALDVGSDAPINALHPAVLFDDRVALQDFGKADRNNSFFAISSIEVSQHRLIDLLRRLYELELESETKFETNVQTKAKIEDASSTKTTVDHYDQKPVLPDPSGAAAASVQATAASANLFLLSDASSDGPKPDIYRSGMVRTA